MCKDSRGYFIVIILEITLNYSRVNETMKEFICHDDVGSDRVPARHVSRSVGLAWGTIFFFYRGQQPEINAIYMRAWSTGTKRHGVLACLLLISAVSNEAAFKEALKPLVI